MFSRDLKFVSDELIYEYVCKSLLFKYDLSNSVVYYYLYKMNDVDHAFNICRMAVDNKDAMALHMISTMMIEEYNKREE
jgi:hypothetical protein